MHLAQIITLAVVIAAVLGLLSSRLIPLDVTDAHAALRPNPIDIMQLMREVKDLPVQAYDAI